MSRIQELIKEMCPNGVQYYVLDDIADTFIGLATSVTKYKEKEGIVLLHNSDIRQNKIILKSIEFISKDFADKNKGKYHRLNDIVTVHTGDVGTSAVISKEYVGSMGFTTLVTRIRNFNLINPHYLCYYFNSDICKRDIARVTISDRSNLNQKEFCKLRIPIPPVEVQEEIVRILDKFSSNGLESLLTLELELRREQYEYYLKRTFKSVSGKKVALGSVVTFNRGKRVVKKDLENDKTSNLFPVYQNSLIPLGYYDKSNFDCKKTIIISAGAAGKIGFVEEKIWAADDCLRCLCSNEILDKYLYYFLKSNESYIQSMVRKASVPRISANVFEKMEIIIPSIDIQRKIIEIFDRFEKIINNVNDGLPAEIELRRQQYEYYRNKLLSFEELSVSE